MSDLGLNRVKCTLSSGTISSQMAANSLISSCSKSVSGVMEQPARDPFIKQHPAFFGLLPSLEDTMFVQEAVINNDPAGRTGLNYK